MCLLISNAPKAKYGENDELYTGLLYLDRCTAEYPGEQPKGLCVSVALNTEIQGRGMIMNPGAMLLSILGVV